MKFTGRIVRKGSTYYILIPAPFRALLEQEGLKDGDIVEVEVKKAQ